MSPEILIWSQCTTSYLKALKFALWQNSKKWIHILGFVLPWVVVRVPVCVKRLSGVQILDRFRRVGRVFRVPPFACFWVKIRNKHKTWVHRIFVGPFGLTCAKLRLELGLILTAWDWAKSDVFDRLFAPEKPKRTVIPLAKVRKVWVLKFWEYLYFWEDGFVLTFTEPSIARIVEDFSSNVHRQKNLDQKSGSWRVTKELLFQGATVNTTSKTYECRK